MARSEARCSVRGQERRRTGCCFEEEATGTTVASGNTVHVSNWSCGPKRTVQPFEGVHRRLTLAVVLRGVFGYAARGEPHTLGPGAILIGTPGEVYRLSHEYGHGDACTVVEYEPGFLGAWTSEDRLRSLLPCLPTTPRVEAVHRLLLDAAQHPAEPLRLEELAQLLLEATVRESAAATGRAMGESESGGATGRDRVWAACQYIDQHLGDVMEPLSLAAMAGAVGVSRFHFLRLFRRHVGLTPYQYVTRARLRRAILLLRESSMTVTEIAYEAGFGCLSNFVRTFHRQVGCTPGAFSSGHDSGMRPLIDDLRNAN